MTITHRDPTIDQIDEILPLRPVLFEMLLILNECDLHGYGLMLELKERSAGRWILGPGTLYRTINEMLDNNMIEPADEIEVAGKKRQYYRISSFGKLVAAAEANRMATLVKNAVDARLI
jgi:DNA-binding PadR family transcriptional regulator